MLIGVAAYRYDKISLLQHFISHYGRFLSGNIGSSLFHNGDSTEILAVSLYTC